jgi:hypothetical protein
MSCALRKPFKTSITSRAEPDASAFRLISRRALTHGFTAQAMIDAPLKTDRLLGDVLGMVRGREHESGIDRGRNALGRSGDLLCSAAVECRPMESEVRTTFNTSRFITYFMAAEWGRR